MLTIDNKEQKIVQKKQYIQVYIDNERSNAPTLYIRIQRSRNTWMHATILTHTSIYLYTNK